MSALNIYTMVSDTNTDDCPLVPCLRVWGNFGHSPCVFKPFISSVHGSVSFQFVWLSIYFLCLLRFVNKDCCFEYPYLNKIYNVPCPLFRLVLHTWMDTSLIKKQAVLEELLPIETYAKN